MISVPGSPQPAIRRARQFPIKLLSDQSLEVTMRTRTLNSPYHYVIIHVSPPTEPLALRHTIQKALQQLFGVTRAGIPIDLLSEDVENVGGKEHGKVVLRTTAEDAEFVLAALPTWSSPTMRLIKHGAFLPGLELTESN